MNNDSIKSHFYLFFFCIGLSCLTLSSHDLYAQSMNDDPCPTPKETLEQQVTDLELVQEDITRLTLCVERAQLLDRLNALVDDNAETIQSSFQDEIEAISNSINFSPVTAPQMPSANAMASSATNETPIDAGWKIKDIYGTNDNVIATLIGADSTIKNVKIGDTLDNNLKITSINMSGVTVSFGPKKASLEWSE